jgi:hypothetical protein
MTVQYAPGRGMLVGFYGFTAVLHEGMTVAAIESYLKELTDFTGEVPPHVMGEL